MAMEYRCTKCGAMPGRERLVAVKVLFTGMGAGAKTHRARTIAHLCAECTKKNPIFQLPAYEQVSEKTHVHLEEINDATS